METFIIIDGMAVLYRAWHALPKLTNPKGKIVNACYGLALLVLKLIREQKPKYIVTTFDTVAPTFRHKLYKKYKANRIKQPKEFYDQIKISKQMLHDFGIKTLEKDGFEADDLIGCLSKLKSKKSNIISLIVTGDYDLFQLVDNKTKIYFLRQGATQIKIYDKALTRKLFDLDPKQLIDFKSLRGDPSDNIPGIPGIGKKTATQLIKEFGSLKNIYQYLKNQPKNCSIKKKTVNLLLNYKKQALLAKTLVTIKQNIKGIDNIEKYKIKKINKGKIRKSFEQLGFKSLIKKLDKMRTEQQVLF